MLRLSLPDARNSTQQLARFTVQRLELRHGPYSVRPSIAEVVQPITALQQLYTKNCRAKRTRDKVNTKQYCY